MDVIMSTMRDKQRVNRDCQTISELLSFVFASEKKSIRIVPDVKAYSAQKITKIDHQNERGIKIFLL